MTHEQEQLATALADEMVMSDLKDLEHPDPDPERLPVLTEKHADLLQTETAGHLLRAILRGDDQVALLKKRMDADMAAWELEIAKAEAKSQNWRAIIRAWMERTGTFRLQTPWFTATLGNARRKIVVDDEAACIAVLKSMDAGSKAVKRIERLDKKEFDDIFNACPKEFGEVKQGGKSLPALAHEEQGEPVLSIRRKG